MNITKCFEDATSGRTLRTNCLPYCKPGGFLVEGDALEVNTLICNYLTARQPSRVDIRAGDTVNIVAWHLVLVDDVGTSSSSAHIAVRVADETVWQRTVAIPSREAVYESDWIPDRDIPAGTDIYFHIHNHGFNSWKLGRLMVTPTGDGD